MDVHCDKSPDGRHEAKFSWRADGLEARCKHCEHYWEPSELARLINAALRLTAEEAEAALANTDPG